MPGMYWKRISFVMQNDRFLKLLTPRMVNRMLMSKSAPHPRSRKTPIGGRKMAKMILQISEAVKAILSLEFGLI